MKMVDIWVTQQCFLFANDFPWDEFCENIIYPRDSFPELVVWTDIALLVTYYKLFMGLEKYNTQLVKV